MISMQWTIGAVMYAIGSILVCVFYGLRWFNGNTAKPLGYAGKWPPIINACPDYLSVYTNSQGKQYCVDYVGFAKQALNVLPTGSTDSALINYPDSKANAIPFSKMLSTPQKCVICQTTGLTWEGIWDGQTCTQYLGPNDIGGGKGEGNCKK